MNDNTTYYGYDAMASPSGGEPLRAPLTWRDYTQVVLERFWIVATVFIAALTLATVHTGRRVPLYRSTARIQLDVPQAKALTSDDVVDVNPRDIAYLMTQLEILQSRSLSEAVARRLATGSGKGLLPDDPASMARVVRSALDIHTVKSTRMFDIVAVHANSDVAAAIANAAAETYIAQNLDQRMEASLDAVQWLHRQAEEHRKRLEASETALQNYKEETLATSLVDEHSASFVKLQTLNAALSQAETRLVSTRTIWSEIEAVRAKASDLLAIDSVAGSPLIQQIHAEILDQQTKIAVLRGRYRDKHPDLIQELKKLEELEEKRRKACDQVADEVKATMDMQLAEVASLDAELKAQQKRTFAVERALMQYHELLRNVEADRELYNSVLARMKETSVSGKLETNNVRLVDSAIPSSAPFNINKRHDLLQAAGFGLFLGLGLCFLAHFVDDRIKRSEDLEQGLGVPVLAVIPKITGKDEISRSQIVEKDRHSAAAEAFRTLRASLSLSPAANKARKLMITSASAGAGKSLVSSNLAAVFAHNGMRTLLIDADLRRPAQQRAFESKSDVGLSHMLAGATPWREIVFPSGIENLDVITVGRIPPNPAELLGTPAMAQLLDEAAREYDKVVLDCPPVFGLSDPLVLMPQTDGIIFVAHFNKSRRRSVAHAVQKLREGSTPLVGAVMNDVDLRRPGGHYYYHQYAYYYDNYDSKQRKKRNKR